MKNSTKFLQEMLVFDLIVAVEMLKGIQQEASASCLAIKVIFLLWGQTWVFKIDLTCFKMNLKRTSQRATVLVSRDR